MIAKLKYLFEPTLRSFADVAVLELDMLVFVIKDESHNEFDVSISLVRLDGWTMRLICDKWLILFILSNFSKINEFNFLSVLLWLEEDEVLVFAEPDGEDDEFEFADKDTCSVLSLVTEDTGVGKACS